MLSIFSCPKPFRGHINTIQRNAIRSWTLLEPRPEITLVGDEEGTAEVCKELGLRQMRDVERNEYGTPLVSDIFEKAGQNTSFPFICYINTDIILLSDIISSISKLTDLMKDDNFLLVGQRWDLSLDHLFDFNVPNLEAELRKNLINNGRLEPPYSIDYFIFPRSIKWNMPPFALGRSAWDSWILFRACELGMPLIDGTTMITAFHQAHDYSHWLKTRFFQKNDEHMRNQRLRGSFRKAYTIYDATCLLTDKGLGKAPKIRHFVADYLRLKMFIGHCLGASYPYSYPLFLLMNLLKVPSRVWHIFKKTAPDLRRN